MPKKTISENEILDKLEYIGLDFENIPKSISKEIKNENIILKSYNEKQYRQYKFIPIKDIQILISSANNLDTLEEKYKKAAPIKEYLQDDVSEKKSIFLRMLENMKIEDVEKIEKEQTNLNKKIPFKIKFENDFLWPIYYLESIDKYIMLLTKDAVDYSTFFFILKKKLSGKKTGKIFVPINNVGYSKEYFEKSQFKNLENYLWTLTKDWPLIYEVTDKKRASQHRNSRRN